MRLNERGIIEDDIEQLRQDVSLALESDDNVEALKLLSSADGAEIALLLDSLPTQQSPGDGINHCYRCRRYHRIPWARNPGARLMPHKLSCHGLGLLGRAVGRCCDRFQVDPQQP